MTDHKVKSQSDFRAGKTVWSRQVTLTCSCGRSFYGQYQGRRGNSKDLLEAKALTRAEQAFRDHIPIR